jgi:hypothetical protein
MKKRKSQIPGMIKNGLTCLLLITVLFMPMATYAADSDDGGWKVSLFAYVFAENIDGDAGLGTSQGPATVPLDVEFSDLLKVIDFAFMGAMMARKDRWSLNADVSISNEIGIFQGTMNTEQIAQLHFSL